MAEAEAEADASAARQRWRWRWRRRPNPPTTSCGRQVAALPDKQRTAVALRFVTDAAYAEIGGVMETSEEAARRNVHEGLKRLRREYGNEH